MASSNFPTKWDVVLAATAGVAQTMNEEADAVLSVLYAASNGTELTPATALSVVATADPAAGEVQFTGVPGNPSNTLTLNTAPADAGGLLLVQYVPAGTIPTP